MPIGVPCSVARVGNKELIANARRYNGITSGVRWGFVVPGQCVCIDLCTYELWPVSVCVGSAEVLWSDFGCNRIYLYLIPDGD
ncbi:hypothetical protein DQ04_15531000 [Trypanosoma grayi]|uniref:hypothetical protein n=1 Tax=Trypanosoma grayi TaxID=71804 RepID=UPI0004F4327B|nr:hypothetical protein DQ04_15531000 [Trypanosoma grayi]KEG06168.1 hypothetical protein DQ04_15531000 [Trypanosoma grayi]